MKKPFVIEKLTVEKVSPEEKSLARHEGKVIFIDNAVPGDVVDVRVFKSKKSFGLGTAIHFHSLSPIRQTPPCAHFTLCGGCQWQDIQYSHQLEFKRNIVKEAFEHVGKVQSLPEILPTVGAEETLYYRNKLNYGFSDKSIVYDESFNNKMRYVSEPGAGFHVPKDFERILDIEHCHLQAEPSNAIRNFIKAFLIENEISIHNVRRHEGWFRDMVVRMTTKGHLMLVIAYYFEDENGAKLMDALLKAFPQIDSLYYVINHKMNDFTGDLDFHLYHGIPQIQEELGHLTFNISPKSFFQTNSKQAKTLYDITKEYAGLTGTERVYDLYTGTGSIALYVADQAKEVFGIEYVEAAIEDAKENAKLNNISNCSFFAGDMAKELNEAFILKHGQPDVIIADPPRAGMHGDVIEMLLKIAAPKIVYVSCNPVTQARDLQLLDKAYRVVKIQPVDMFPHTKHVENIALLELK